jgi:hypothetical protein
LSKTKGCLGRSLHERGVVPSSGKAHSTFDVGWRFARIWVEQGSSAQSTRENIIEKGSTERTREIVESQLVKPVELQCSHIVALADYVLWRDRMGVPSRCTIVRATGRPAYAQQVLSGRDKTQKNKRKKESILYP